MCIIFPLVQVQTHRQNRTHDLCFNPQDNLLLHRRDHQHTQQTVHLSWFEKCHLQRLTNLANQIKYYLYFNKLTYYHLNKLFTIPNLI